MAVKTYDRNFIPSGNAWRGMIPDLFTTTQKDKEEWIRSEQSAENAFNRSVELQTQAQDFEKEMSNTAYQRAIEDMKKAGLNPLLAYSQGGANMSSTAVGSSTPASRTPSSGGDVGSVINGTAKLIQVIAGLVTKKPKFGFGKN